MKFEDFFHVFEGYFNSKFGTKEFLLALLTKIQGQINDATPQHLIKLAFICNKAQADLGGLLKTIEVKVIEQVDKLTFDELCNCGVAFDMFLQLIIRCQKFGGLTLGRKPKKKETHNKKKKTQL